MARRIAHRFRCHPLATVVPAALAMVFASALVAGLASAAPLDAAPPAAARVAAEPRPAAGSLVERGWALVERLVERLRPAIVPDDAEPTATASPLPPPTERMAGELDPNG